MKNTKIEWAHHIDPHATGRVLGAYKTAAQRTGCSVAEWIQERLAGRLWCFRCRCWKTQSLFTVDKSRRGGKSSTCKACTSDASTASRYGMNLEALHAFRSEHGHRCAICASTHKVVVDHNHATGKPRGLLCPNCNSAIGKLKESPTLFAAALRYLEKHNGKELEN